MGFKGFAAGLALAALAATSVQAAGHDVRIRRDEWGVPHILGKTDADAAYGLGYAQAEDDFATLQEGTLTARGRLATLKGEAGLQTDYLVALMDIRASVDAGYADLPADIRAILEAYADGVNAYGARHPEQAIAGLLPFTGKDMAAGFAFNGHSFYGLDDVIRRTMRPAKPATDKIPTGSNGLAIGPSRSAEGATRLLVNSHQPFTGPFAWYEAVVESGSGWHVAGGFFPGSPFLLHGHNAHLGWANTVNNPDLVDVYALTINPENPDQYRLDGQWKDLTKRTVEIAVKQADDSLKTVAREVLRSVHGPVVRTDHGVFAIRYAAMGEIRQPIQYFALNKARTLAEFKAAMGLQILPAINYVYADEKGNVGYVYNGRFPVRSDGVDWSGVVPGDRSDLIPTREVPFSGVPQVWNPEGGLVFNSNNTPLQATDPGAGMDPAAYPKWMGLQTNMTNRAFRVLETYVQDPSITEAEFDAYKWDLAYSARSDAAKLVAAASGIDPKGDPDLAAALALARAWDFRTNVENRSTALVLLTATRIQQGAPPLEALRAVIADLKTTFGRIDPEWGQVNRMRRGRVDVPIDGGPDVYRAIYGRPGPDGRLTAAGGDTYVMFVSWDRTGRLSSRSVHQFGSATLDAASPHYADQLPLFVAHRTKPVWFTEADLKGHIVKDYRPGE